MTAAIIVVSGLGLIATTALVTYIVVSTQYERLVEDLREDVSALRREWAEFYAVDRARIEEAVAAAGRDAVAKIAEAQKQRGPGPHHRQTHALKEVTQEFRRIVSTEWVNAE